MTGGAHPIAAPLSSHRGPRLFASLGSPHHGTASEQLRIICLHTVCVRPARRPSGHCHARPSARVSSTGLETQGPEASLLLLQRNLVYAPLRSAHHRVAFARMALFGERSVMTRESLNKAGPHRLVSLCVFIFFALREIFRGDFLSRGGESFFFRLADPRIGDGYTKLSLTPAGVPNES